MLNLTRRPGESIFINTPSGDRIVITNCGTRGRQTKIGINAPKDYGIVREELVERDKGVGVHSQSS